MRSSTDRPRSAAAAGLAATMTPLGVTYHMPTDAVLKLARASASPGRDASPISSRSTVPPLLLACRTKSGQLDDGSGEKFVTAAGKVLDPSGVRGTTLWSPNCPETRPTR